MKYHVLIIEEKTPDEKTTKGINTVCCFVGYIDAASMILEPVPWNSCHVERKIEDAEVIRDFFNLIEKKRNSLRVSRIVTYDRNPEELSIDNSMKDDKMNFSIAIPNLNGEIVRIEVPNGPRGYTPGFKPDVEPPILYADVYEYIIRDEHDEDNGISNSLSRCIERLTRDIMGHGVSNLHDPREFRDKIE